MQNQNQYLCILPIAKEPSIWDQELFCGFLLCGKETVGITSSYSKDGFVQVSDPAEMPHNGIPVYLKPTQNLKKSAFQNLCELVNAAIANGYRVEVRQVGD